MPYIILLGGYGFSTVYNNKRLRYILGLGFVAILVLNVALLLMRLGGKLHTDRMYDRLLEVHESGKNATLGAFTNCYVAPHYTLLHGYLHDTESR